MCGSWRQLEAPFMIAEKRFVVFFYIRVHMCAQICMYVCARFTDKWEMQQLYSMCVSEAEPCCMHASHAVL